jgi:Na+-driven multidrug efflux pump
VTPSAGDPPVHLLQTVAHLIVIAWYTIHMGISVHLTNVLSNPRDTAAPLTYSLLGHSSCRMPSGALVPDTKGTTPLDSWLASHLEGMSARADQRTSEAQMLNTPLE